MNRFTLTLYSKAASVYEERRLTYLVRVGVSGAAAGSTAGGLKRIGI
jgi:hypothetical protein